MSNKQQEKDHFLELQKKMSNIISSFKSVIGRKTDTYYKTITFFFFRFDKKSFRFKNCMIVVC